MSRVLSWKLVGAKDFDGNGSADILIRNSNSGAWYNYLYDGINVISRRYMEDLPGDLNEIVQAVADFDGDGINDVLMRNATTNKWSILHLDGFNLKNTLNVSFESSSEWVFNAAGDYNGDGNADVTLRNVNSGQIIVYLWNGSGVISSTYTSNSLLTDYEATSLLH